MTKKYHICSQSIHFIRQTSITYSKKEESEKIKPNHATPLKDQNYDQMQDDLQKLQNKLRNLEQKVKTSTTKRPLYIDKENSLSSTKKKNNKTVKPKSSSKKASIRRTTNLSSSKSRKRSISNSSQSSKSIKESFYNSLTRSNNVNDKYLSLKSQYEANKKELLKERQANYALKWKVEKYEKMSASKSGLSQEYKRLQLDYKSLVQSFEQSEEIRRKQKILIKELKEKIEGKPTNNMDKDIEVTAEDSRATHNYDAEVKMFNKKNTKFKGKGHKKGKQ